MVFSRKLIILAFLICVLNILIYLMNQNDEIDKDSWFSSYSSPFSKVSFSSRPLLRTRTMEGKTQESQFSASLRYDYYNESCPQVEQIVKSTLQELYKLKPNIAPQLIRLVFHDCFIEGCDASVLLDPHDGFETEKDSPPNESLKGFDHIDIIKSEMEEACPGVVSCADILVLAARESVLLAGGPYYHLSTGRRDSSVSYSEEATYGLPSPQDDVVKITEKFASRGFDEREAVSLLGAHSTGMIHCKFILHRLYNFGGTKRPDPSIDPRFLNLLRSHCKRNHTSVTPSASLALTPLLSSSISGLSSSIIQEPEMKMKYEGSGSSFGTLYYRSLLRARGILYADQQLTASKDTETWVRAYASDASLFQKDFARAMIKLSNHRVLTAPLGQVRSDCRRIGWEI